MAAPSTPSLRADRLKAYLERSMLFDSVERVGASGIRVSVWDWSEERLEGQTLTGLLIVQ